MVSLRLEYRRVCKQNKDNSKYLAYVLETERNHVVLLSYFVYVLPEKPIRDTALLYALRLYMKEHIPYVYVYI